MSLNKAIEHGKEYRRQWHKSKAFSKSCRCHGGCEWCLENRMHKNDKKMQNMDDELKEWESDICEDCKEERDKEI